MIQHNSYFDGAVQSLGFERHGQKQSVGVLAPGSHHFGTDAPERMHIINGEVLIQLDGSGVTQHYPQGTAFEVPANSGFSITVKTPSAYWCEYL
jgi:uncharacterized protein YaiE (UPF0345 family)